MSVSIIIRTLNEERYLRELLLSIKNQDFRDEVEVVVVDSGSIDSTIEIAKNFQCKITYIKKTDFTFGRSLNVGCRFSSGEILVFISGHCVPTDDKWLINLTKPIISGKAAYVYGRQIGRDSTKFSENNLFEKYYPNHKNHQNEIFFCNNANSAIKKDIWEKYLFDENLTGLEDIDLGKRIFDAGEKISYAFRANVYHIHNESHTQTRNRYEREAIALKSIIPGIKMTFFDFCRFFFAAIFLDLSKAIERGVFIKEFFSIFLFRFNQYLGSYRGTNSNNSIEKLSEDSKEKYFYPK